MGMKSAAKACIVEGYKYNLEPAQGSPGEHHGAAVFIETFGKVTVSDCKAVLSPLPFFVFGCSDGADAVGLGAGSVEARGNLVTRSIRKAILLEGDVGECTGYLFSPTRGVLPCKCTMKLRVAQTTSPSPAPVTAAAAVIKEERSPRDGQLKITGIDGKPVPDVPVRFSSSDGKQIVVKTDRQGIVRYDGLSFQVHQVTAGEDPRNWSPVGRRNPLEIASFDLNTFLKTTYGKSQEQFRGLGREPEKRTFGAELVSRADDLLPWIGPALLGEFNENATIGQIIFDTVVTLFPFADQIGDVRDVVAVLVRMREPGEISEFMNWVTLTTCVIGAIPTVGSALRGAYRIFLRDYLKSGSKLGEATSTTVDQMLDAMRALGIGDPRAVLRTSVKELADKAVAAYRVLVERLEEVLKFIAANASAGARSFAQDMRKLVPLPQAERRIRAAVAWLHEKTLTVLDEGLKMRPEALGYKDTSDAWAGSMRGSASAEIVVRNTPNTIPNAIQTFSKPALRLTAKEWRQATHAIIRNALSKSAVERSFKHKGKTYTIWHGESGLLYGTYDDLDKLAALFKEMHPQVYGKPRGTVEVDPIYDVLKDYYTVGAEVFDRRRKGFQHQHVVDQKDMADLFLKPGAKMIPLDGDIDAFVKTKEELEEIYKQLPCVTVSRDRHIGTNSLSSLTAKNRQYNDLKQLRLTYSEIYGELLEPKEAREVRKVLKQFVQFVSERQ